MHNLVQHTRIGHCDPVKVIEDTEHFVGCMGTEPLGRQKMVVTCFTGEEYFEYGKYMLLSSRILKPHIQGKHDLLVGFDCPPR